MRKPVLLVGVLAALAAAAKRVRSQRAEREMWIEATKRATPDGHPDLR